ncbi:MAG: VOC family protein [Dokdonella sp.]|uniref:VOC family protein n=1 Tax=Dokdonella sp. TaxID=2291710 RepID=UPI003F81C164
MSRRVAQVALLVRDYDEAIAWYADALGFVLLEDTDLGGGKRWVRIAPFDDAAFALLLAKAADERQLAAVGNQHGGRVGWFLHTDDFARDHARLTAAGARFDGRPRHEGYGTVIVFTDLYGNRWDLIGPRTGTA